MVQLLLLLLTLSGGQSFAIELDQKLLRPWQVSAKLPCKAPFLASYRKDGKEFSFLAVNHLEGPTSLSSGELEILRDQIKIISPEKMIVEMDTGNMEIPRDAVERMNAKCFNKNNYECGESLFTAHLAAQQSIRTVGAEPSQSRIDDSLKGEMPTEDLLGIRSIKALISMRRSGIPTSQFETLFTQHMRNMPIDWNYTKFANWLKAKIGNSPSEVSDNWIEPRVDGAASATQKLVARQESIRESAILEQVQRTLNESNKSMMIYGFSHFYKQARAFEKALGHPRIECFDTQVKPQRDQTPRSPPGTR